MFLFANFPPPPSFFFLFPPLFFLSLLANFQRDWRKKVYTELFWLARNESSYSFVDAEALNIRLSIG